MVAAHASILNPYMGLYCQAGSVYCCRAGGPQSLLKSRDVDRPECQQLRIVISTSWHP